MRHPYAYKTGFTIVELLIVIIIIGILAAISVVSYSRVQDSARVAAMKSDFRVIKQAMDAYKSEHGEYPLCPGASPGHGCGISQVSKEFSIEVPTRYRDSSIAYVAMNNPGSRWAIKFRNGAEECKVGENMISGWWSNAPTCW